MHYYFLATLLPTLKFGEETEMSLQDFKELLVFNLSPQDFAKIQILLRFYDWINLRAFWKKQTLGIIGNWDEYAFEALMPDDVDVPPYFKIFLENYPQKEEQIAHFSELLLQYYQEPVKKGFLSWWLKFEGGMRLNLAAIRSIVQNKPLDKEFLFQNSDDEEAAQMRADVSAKDFRPKEPYQNLMDLYLQHQKNPLELDQSLDRFRFKAVEDRLAFDHFSINYILAYTVLFLMNLKFTQRNEKGAKTLVEKYLKEVFQ